LPRGSVASYGDIAARVGLPRHARLVARVLAGLADPSVPWHRVLRAGYRIAFAPGSEGFRRQRQRLEAEGHTVRDNGRVVPAMRAVDLDRALWGDFL
jgi:methylated-DNA-protein-cysteine methyltransferase-like protein